MKQFIRITLALYIVLTSYDVNGQGWTVNPADYVNTGTVTAIVFNGTTEVSSGTLGVFVGGICRGYSSGQFFPPTGKTTFTIMCNSNAVSGEIMTFQYYDTSNGIFYDINETVEFISDMIIGSAVSPLQFHTKPLVYSVTGGGSYCEGASGLPVGLSSTETGVTYTLLKNGSALSPTVAGTGSAISFDNQLAGTYTVTGTNSGGTITMAGNAIIIENPLPLIPIANPGSGATCSQITSNWASSSYATSYVLDVSAVNDFATYLNGYQNINVGNVTTYPVSGLSPGTIYYYRVRAVNSCGTSASSSVISYSTSPAAPSQPGTITGTAAQCPALALQTYSISSVPNATTYTWTVPAGWSITAGQGTTSISVTTGTTGQNGSITVNAGNSCGTSANVSISVTVLSLSTSPTGVSITNNNSCNGTVKTLSVSGGSLGTGGSWNWYSGLCGGTIAGNGSSITVDPPSGSNTTYFVLASGTCNTTACASGTVAVTTRVGTPTSPTTTSSIICQGTLNTVFSTSASNATSYNWTITGAGNIISGSGISGTVTWSPAFFGSATVTVTANGCGGPSSESSTVVTVRPTPTASIGGSTTVCRNSPSPNVIFTNPQPLSVIVSYNINGGTSNNITIDGNSSASVPVSTTGTGTFVYNMTAVSYQSVPLCANSLTGSATIIVNPIPVPTLISTDPDNIICAGTSVTFTAGGGTNFNFRIGNITVQNGTSSTYTTSSLSNGQVVDVIVTNSSGCSLTSASITNFVNPLPIILVTTSPTCATDLLTYSLGVTVSSGIVTSSSGLVTNTGGTVWSITGIPSGTNSTVRVSDLNSCENTLSVTAPNCDCPSVQAPASNGDKSYCQSGAIPPLSVAVSTGETADWYNAPTGGSLLLANSLTFTPSAAGSYYAVARNTTSGCLSSTRTLVRLIMNSLPIPSITSSDNDNIFCSGSSITFMGGGGTSYNFRIGGTSVQNGPTSAYTTTLLTNGQIVDVVVTNSSGCSASSGAISNTVNSLPTPTLISSDSDNKFCSGTSITFTAGGGDTYNFRLNGTSVQSGSLPTYSTSSLTNGQTVDVIVTNSNGCPATSGTIVNTVYALPAPTLTSSDADNAFCAGTSITFTAGGGSTFNFMVGGVSAQNGASSTYTTSTLTNGTAVNVIVSNVNGCSSTSAVISNTVNDLPSASLSSSDADNKFCSGTSITFTAAGGTNYNFRIGGVSIQNSSSPIYTTNSLANGQVLDVVVSNSLGCSVTPSALTNTVYPLPIVTLTGSDADNIFCTGTNVTFTASGGTNYTFRVGGTSVQNGSLSTYSTSSLTNGQVVDVIATNSYGCTTTSSGITNFVNPLPLILITTPPSCSSDLTNYSLVVTVGSGSITSTAGTVINAGLNVWTIAYVPSGTAITVKVKDVSGCENALSISPPNCSCPVISAPTSGGNKSFCSDGVVPTITASVIAGETVDWYDAPSGGVILKSSSLSFTPSAAGTYYALARNTTSGCVSSSRTGITVTMNAQPVTFFGSSDLDNTFCVGTSITFTASGGTTYNFRINSASVQNSTSSSFTTNSLTNGQVADVIVTSSSGCSATSAGIVNNVNALPVPTLISSDPDNKFCPGTSITLTAGGGISYNFRVAGTSVQNSESTTYTTTTLTNGQITDVIVTNGNGCSATSTGITNTVYALPVATISSSDADNSLCQGTKVTFTASGGSNYNFRVDGETVQNGTTATFATNSLTSSQVVDVIVTNSSGCSATSGGIANTVNAMPIPVLLSSDQDNKFCSGTSITFTASGGVNYNFRIGGTSVQNSSSSVYTTTALTNGQTVDVIVTNVSGCTATSTGILNTVYALPSPAFSSSDNDNRLCSGTAVTFTAGGGTSYNFRLDGLSVQDGASTTYTTSSLTNGQVADVIVTNSNGCTSLSAGKTNMVLDLPVPSLTSSDADNIFCAGSTVTFTAGGGSNFIFRKDGISVQNGTTSAYTTSTLTNGQVIDVIVTNSNGCSATSSIITNTVTEYPVANAGTGGNECDLDFLLNAVPSIGTGTWTKTTGPGSAIFTPNANSPNAIVKVSAYGTYTFVWTEVSNGCLKSSSITVVFYQQPTANAGSGGISCGSVGFAFNAAPSVGTGTWSKTSGPGTVSFNPNANSPTAVVTVSSYGDYTFTWTEVNGVCSRSATVNVTFNQIPVANAGADMSECGPDHIMNATPTTTGSGTWTKSAGPGNAIFSPDASKPNASVRVDQYGTYDFVWTVLENSCQASDIVRIVFHSLPAINAGRDTSICKGDNAQLLSTGTGSVLWEPAELFTNPTVKNPGTKPLTSTTFKVTLTDLNGCKNSDQVRVEVKDIPLANAGSDQILEYQFGTTLAAIAAGVNETGTWSMVSGTGKFADASLASTSVSDLSLGKNVLKWSVNNGVCPLAKDSIIITVHDLLIPTLITPNMDGKNDYLVLRGIEALGKTELIIFDRRGAQVYKNSNYNNDWNGVDFNGKPLPFDTYYYVLKAQNGKSASGYIVIRR